MSHLSRGILLCTRGSCIRYGHIDQGGGGGGIGLHCPAGSNLPVPCNPGYFTNMSQASECLICPEGFYYVPKEVVSGIVTLIRG